MAQKKAYQIIALTGGIGSGKSTFGELLRRRGIAVLEADKLTKEVSKAKSPALTEMIELLGKTILLPNGDLDRNKVKKIIFSNSDLRKKVENIIHPKVQLEFQKQVEELKKEGKSLIFYEIPLLFESNSKHNFDLVVCITTPDPIRIKRLVQQRKLSTKEVEKIIASQMLQEEKSKKADYVIENIGTKEDMEAQISNLLKILSS